MEDAFLELYQQFKVLQTICFQQKKLLQRLLSKDVPSADMGISKPIQCTDAGDPTCSESHPLRLTELNASSTETASTRPEEPYQPLEKEDHPSFSFDFSVQFPPNIDQYSFLASQVENKELCTGVSKSDVGLEKSERNANFAFVFLKKYAPSIPNHDFLPADPDHTFSLANIYEELCFLQAKDKSAGDFLDQQNRTSSGVRGPAQSSWSPGYLSDECQLFHHENNNSDVGFSSQICEFCQAVFPAGAATKSEFIQHITEHMEYPLPSYD